MKIGMVSLGCAKNRVDAENMLGLLQEAGHEIIGDASEADAIIVNTCGFIESARQEAIDAIFEMAALRREGAKILISGCLAQRYHQDLMAEMPEADAILGIGGIHEIVEHINRLAEGERFSAVEKPFVFQNSPRVLTTGAHAAYLKIADGCDNRCAYCAIPGIRGGYLSRGIEDIVSEAVALAANGAKELSLIAQDTTRYGMDIYGKPSLKRLLERLCENESDIWLRCLYLYPELIDEELLDAMAENPKVCKYLDVPIQHVNNEVLTNMNRRGGRAAIERMYALARERGFTLRTTVLLGFPGETETQYNELLSFLADHPFDRLGAFAFSKEEGTAAEKMSGQINKRIREKRAQRVMEQQAEISKGLLQKRIGEECRVLLDGFTQTENGEIFYIARSQKEAPEADGVILLPKGAEDREVGAWADIRVTDASEHDLWGVFL